MYTYIYKLPAAACPSKCRVRAESRSGKKNFCPTLAAPCSASSGTAGH